MSSFINEARINPILVHADTVRSPYEVVVCLPNCITGVGPLGCNAGSVVEGPRAGGSVPRASAGQSDVHIAREGAAVALHPLLVPNARVGGEADGQAPSRVSAHLQAHFYISYIFYFIDTTFFVDSFKVLKI